MTASSGENPAAPRLETLRVEVDGDTAVATLCRPERLNAVADRTLRDLVELADWLRERADLRFLVLDHEGPVFAAGAHLHELREVLAAGGGASTWLRANQHVAQEMMRKLSSVEQISFAALRGSAYGAGVAIAMCCDFRVLADDAVLNLPETKLGMFLTYGSTPLLVRAVGPAAARRMIYFAEDVSADEALAAGAVDWVAPAARVRAAVEERIGVLRSRDAGALRIAKRTIDAGLPPSLGDLRQTEPELAAAAISEGRVLRALEQFATRKG